MKKIFFYITALLLTVMATSCEDFLEEEAFGKPTSEEMLQDPDNLARIVGQAYSEVKWLHDHWGYWGINSLSSDECINPVRNPGNDWNDDGYWANFNTQEWTASDQSFEYVWQSSNSGAVLCNKILAQLNSLDGSKKIDPELLARFKAETKVLRCYYYYTLFDAFGRIPYVESYDESAENVPQSEANVVWNKLVTQLEEEAPKLPLANVPSKIMNYGRCTQGMAYALLARLYLNAPSFGVTPANAGIESIKSEQDFYTKCIEACNKIVASNVYSIEPDFFTNFKIHNEGSEENIFVIVEDGNAKNDYRDVAGKMANKLRITMLTLNYTHQIAWEMKEKPWNGFCATPSFLAKYQYGIDKRGACDSTKGTEACNGWGWFLGPVKNADGDTLVMTDKENLPAIMCSNVGDNKNVKTLSNASHNDGARLLKYEVDKAGVNKFCDNDFVLFRYADVLYMRAEAVMRGGQGVTMDEVVADPQFQLIRTRAGLPAYGAGDINEQELLDERGREFAWENLRRRDLIRFNKFSQGTWTFKAKVDQYRDWFPIPRKMIEVSAGKWTQNLGYDTEK